jgi:hypothetical protein
MSLSARKSLLVVLGTFLTLAAVLQLRDTSGIVLLGWSVPDLCLWKRVFGWSCPSCGITRSCVAMMHGQPELAFRLHPLGPVVVSAAALTFGYQSWQVLRRRRAETNTAQQPAGPK